MKPLLIGLHGKPRVGKDTVAKHLVQKYDLLKYGPSVRVKLTTAAMFDFPVGYLDDDNMKDQIDPYWGMTYRQMAQRVGKESSRDVFGDDIWMRHVERKLKQLEAQPEDDGNPYGDFDRAPIYKGMILADVRYLSEIEWIKAHGGHVMYIVREGASHFSGKGHVADQGLPIEHANYIIYNNSTIDVMIGQAEFCFKDAVRLQSENCNI